jgi:hypothetical protein
MVWVAEAPAFGAAQDLDSPTARAREADHHFALGYVPVTRCAYIRHNLAITVGFNIYKN